MLKITIISLCLATFSILEKTPITLYLPIVSTDNSELYYTALAGYQPTYWHNELIVFDADEVPTVYYGKELGYQYNPVTVGQYALSLYNAYLDTKDAEDLRLFWVQVHYLQTHYKSIGTDGAAFTYEFPLSSYNLMAGWISGLGQGHVLSVLRRAYTLDPKPEFLELARKTKNVMMTPVSAGGTLAITPEGQIWIEEAPSTPPSLILNGNIYALIGLYDYTRMFPNDLEAQQLFKDGLKSLDRSIGYYDTGETLLYDRLYHTPVSNSYITVHVREIHHIAQITGDEYYDKLAEKWQMYEK